MNSKIILLFLISGLSFIFSQSIDCIYSGTTTYQCALIFNNAAGFDNFTSIGGTHLENKTNADVLRVTRENGTSLNFPSIICEQFPNIIEINIARVGMTTLSHRSFAGCLNILKILIYSNSLSTPPVDLLTNNHHLQVFGVYTNNISDPIPVGIFDPTPNITFFCHEHNPTGVILSGLFRGLTKMDEIHIDNMLLTELPSGIFSEMNVVNFVRAHTNQIKVLHQSSFACTKNRLTILDFRNNQLEAIDRMIFKNTPVLATVDFSDNVCNNRSFSNFNVNRVSNMAALEPCFAEYDRRFPRSDDFTCNFINHPVYGYTCELVNYKDSITVISNPDCVNFADVTGLIFTSSMIKKIPQIIFSTFQNLKYVQAKNVGLETALIENCGDNLKFIDVSHNSIRALPSNSFACQNIEEIITDDNCILSVQPCESIFVENLPNLKTLSMKKTLCVDAVYDMNQVEVEDIEKDMRKCFKSWYLIES